MNKHKSPFQFYEPKFLFKNLSIEVLIVKLHFYLVTPGCVYFAFKPMQL